jgi:hypothetical protein
MVLTSVAVAISEGERNADACEHGRGSTTEEEGEEIVTSGMRIGPAATPQPGRRLPADLQAIVAKNMNDTALRQRDDLFKLNGQAGVTPDGTVAQQRSGSE